MGKFIIAGGNKLKGEIEVGGAKNAALKSLAASLLTGDECVVKNVPQIEDVRIMKEILENLGVKAEEKEGEYFLKNKNIKKTDLNPELFRKLRASIVLVGPLLARFGEVKFSYPGGDIIGKRPIDIFLTGFSALGAEVKKDGEYYHLKAKRLKGTKFVFPWVSVTATESLILAACLGEGVTTLVNAAQEPEIPVMCETLNQAGAKISGAGTSLIKIEGVKKISGCSFLTIPDRIETGTFAILAALTGKGVKITHCQPVHLEVFWLMLKKAGVRFKLGPDYVEIEPTNNFYPMEVRSHEYPGFATDLLPPFTVLLTRARGISLLHETIFEGRLFYTDILSRMGANIIMCDPHRVIVSGPTKLYGRKVESPDIRAGMAILMAALIAEGETAIDHIYQIDRGYEKIEERLKKLGANIKRE